LGGVPTGTTPLLASAPSASAKPLLHKLPGFHENLRPAVGKFDEPP